jgi:hypothetical protein
VGDLRAHTTYHHSSETRRVRVTPTVKLLAVLALLTAAVVAQETKWAPIPASNTRLLWLSVGLAIIAYVVLRSGWGRATAHTAEQRALGTISNSYYEPRRTDILSGFTIGGGIAGAMWWGATSWLVLVRGIQRTSAARGLINLQIAVTVGILAGGIVGAAFGLAVGEWWERRHRAKRAKRPMAADF